MHRPLLRSDYGPRHAAIYARVAAIHERSARLLGANGDEVGAARAVRFARDARDLVAWPDAAARMYSFAHRARDAPVLDDLLDEALDGAMSFLGADFGNVQLVDPRTNALRIVRQRGFDREFLEHFAVVEDGEAACGRAAAARRQTVIGDVNIDPAFAPHRAIAAASGFRAVQSTPLVDNTGRLHGVLSTHFRVAHRPPAQDLRMIETFAWIVAEAIVRQRRSVTAA